jgi:hypothetical protein
VASGGVIRHERIVNHNILHRRLWYSEGRQIRSVDESFLREDSRSLVVLGEAGMGKTTLLGSLRKHDGYGLCSARQLINSPDPREFLGEATTLVIDALDEVSAQRDGDAVDLVVRALARLGNPRFILSCRVADWRSATSRQAIADFYTQPPLELHLEALERADAAAFLAESLQADEAESVLDRLEASNLPGLWSNPQTLGMIERVAREHDLPVSKGALFDRAVSLLVAEHREEKAGTTLAGMAEEDVLDAAGAAFAAIILAGKEALSRKAETDADDLPLREVLKLPGAGPLANILDARLFAARGQDRFTYAHRSIGEFLGARWLARQADTPRKQRRLLELFGSQPLVPSSLRGIHAWLAWHSPALAPVVIASDPMGLIEYGDADKLTPAEGRALLYALRDLSRENPSFRGWADYRVAGLAQPALLDELREALTAADTEPSVRLLVLEALEGSPLVGRLQQELLQILLDETALFALRSEAGLRLISLKPPLEWPKLLATLNDRKKDDDVRLALELMRAIGFEEFEDPLIRDVTLAQLERTERMVGVYFGLEQELPADRIDPLLDAVAEAAKELGNRHERRMNNAITDLAFGLIARRLEGEPPEPGRLWSWLEPFSIHIGFRRESREAVAHRLQNEHGLRQALQHYVLFEQPGDKTVWDRAWRLADRSSGLAPTDDDVLILLRGLKTEDNRWRDLVRLARHSAEEGETVRKAAERFAKSEEDRHWLATLSNPPVPEWQIEQDKAARRRKDEREAQWADHRRDFMARIDAVRGGDYGAVVNPAKAYLKLFYDVGDEQVDGPSRLEEWLGSELRDACLAGFEAFLLAEPPKPTADEIATSFADGRHWEAGYIIVSALAERLRQGRGFADLSSERLMAGLFELLHTHIHDHAGIGDLAGALSSALRERGEWEAAQRLYIEPQLAKRADHVSGLYPLLHEPLDSKLAETLAIDWLERFQDMGSVPEAELIDHLLASERGVEVLRVLLPRRRGLQSLSNERRLTWDAVGLLVDFEATRKSLEAAGKIEPALLWHVRARLGGRFGTARLNLNAAQLDFLIKTFRGPFPIKKRPDEVTTGDTNPWDASEFIGALINRLADDVSDAAIAALAELRDDQSDDYFFALRVAAAEQKRKRVEADWRAPDLATIASATADEPPTDAAQMQAILLDELSIVQKKLRGSDVDWYRDFYKGPAPRVEDDCRDTLIKMMRPLPFGIEAVPEGHLADDKRCDVICTLGNLMVPIEVKGQWHPELWTAADQQLDRLYVNDWRATRGIYLVLWFGGGTPKPLMKPPRGGPLPKSADELREALMAQSATTRDGRTQVVVLDLTRPE